MKDQMTIMRPKDPFLQPPQLPSLTKPMIIGIDRFKLRPNCKIQRRNVKQIRKSLKDKLIYFEEDNTYWSCIKITPFHVKLKRVKSHNILHDIVLYKNVDKYISDELIYVDSNKNTRNQHFTSLLVNRTLRNYYDIYRIKKTKRYRYLKIYCSLIGMGVFDLV